MERMKTVTTPELLVRAAPGSLPRITITTDAVDAMRDRILQGGLTFRTPLPVLFAHDYHDLPVGQSTHAMIARLPHRTEAQWRTSGRRRFGTPSSRASSARRSACGCSTRRPTTRAATTSPEPVPANPECVRLLKDLGWGAGRGRREADDAVVLFLDESASDAIVLHLVDEPEPLYVFDGAHRMTEAEIRAVVADTVRAAVGPTLRAVARLRGSRR